MTTATATAEPDAAAIQQAIELLAAGGVVELRAFAPDRYSGTVTVSGYFNDAAKLAKEAARLNAEGAECYVTLNPIKPALLARRANRIERKPKSTTADSDVTRRLWFLIDVDAVRPSDVSASDEEHEAALQRTAAIRDELHYNHAWPAPIEADSGNGGHLLYSVSLPNDDAARDLLQQCLAALASQFNDDAAIVDQQVFNAGRIVKLYGCVASKGDSLSDRPHRLSRILAAPEHIEPVTIEQLGELASLAPADKGRPETNGRAHHGPAGTIDVDAYLREHGVEVVLRRDWSKGRKWILKECPWCQSTDKGAAVLLFHSGAVWASCRHNRCTGKGWDEFKDAVDPGWRERKEERQEQRHERNGRADGGNAKAEASEQETEPLIPTSAHALAEQFPRLKAPLVHGLIRVQETANVIAPSKAGKSWLTYGLALSVATGSTWLDTFPTVAGRVLIIDNELHPETLAHRIPVVAEALAIASHEYLDRLDVVTLRGRLTTIYGLADLVDDVAGKYQLVIVDAFYRMLGPDTSENSNADIAQIYNCVDQYAAKSGAAWAFIHHSTKGSQSEKAVVDVGAGAGSQSRAADCHLILRPHEEAGCVVLEAAVRSWPPVEPLPLRWTFPVWTPDVGLDPKKLRGLQTMAEQKQSGKDLDGIVEIMTVLRERDATPGDIAKATTLTPTRARRLLNKLFTNGDLDREAVEVKGNETYLYRTRKEDEST